MIEVIETGLLTTVQDEGRLGYISRGIALAGAFDNFSYRVGNIIVGNQSGGYLPVSEQRGEACLEMTLKGPKLRVLSELVVSITGADMSPMLDNKPISMWESIHVKKGSILSFGNTKQGVRSYLCLAGGIDVPLFLGSRSTFVAGQIGGLEGRGVKVGDKLKVKNPTIPLESLEGRRIKQELIPIFKERWTIRVILGPQDYLFKEESVKVFLEADWKASNSMDRRGIRLVGPKLDFKPKDEYLIKISGTDPSNIVSDPIPIGGIIVPGGIEPIICPIEGPGIGGYAKIATVISADLSSVAQIRPGNIVNFKAVTMEEAVTAMRQKEKLIKEIIAVQIN